jgi:hypothetical protein
MTQLTRSLILVNYVNTQCDSTRTESTVLYFDGLNVISSCAVCSVVLISEARISYEISFNNVVYPVSPKGTVSLEMFRG